MGMDIPTRRSRRPSAQIRKCPYLASIFFAKPPRDVHSNDGSDSMPRSLYKSLVDLCCNSRFQSHALTFLP